MGVTGELRMSRVMNAARIGRVQAAQARSGAEQLNQVRFSGGMQALKIRMKSIANVGKITKAQQMVASSKLRGAEKRMNDARPMVGAMEDLFSKLAKSEENPDGAELTPKSVCVVPVSSDKGMCGSINTNMIKLFKNEVVPALEADKIDINVVVVGDKARSQLRRTHPAMLAAVMTQVFGQIPPNFAVAACIAEEVLQTDSDSTTILFNQFISTMTQMPNAVDVPSFKLIAEGCEEDPFLKFETEDERTEVFESFAEFNLAVVIFGALLENSTSEIASKMAAMDNATRNAQDIFDALELKYNKARRASITTELIEIISGAESLKG